MNLDLTNMNELFFGMIAFVAVVLGVLPALVSFYDLFWERRALDKVYALIGPETDGCRPVLEQEGLEAVREELKEQSGTVIFERVEDILIALKSNRGSGSLPELYDLHRMAAQSMLSRKAPTLLRISSSVLLIMGICGTLWCVGGAMQNGGIYAERIMDRLPQALEPSKWAVLFTIILLCIRGVYEACTERFICAMDRLTTSRILPDLQQDDEIESVMAAVAEHLSSFSGALDSFQVTADRMTDFAAEFSTRSSGLMDLGQKLDTVVSEIKSGTEEFKSMQGKVSEQVSTAVGILQGLKEEMAQVEQRRISMEAAIEQVSRDCTSIQQGIDGVGTLSSVISGLSDKVELAAGQLGVIDELKNQAGDLKEKLRSTSESFNSELSRHEEALAVANGLYGEVAEKLGSYEEQSHQLSDTVVRVDDKVNELRTTGDEYQRELQTLRVHTNAATEEADKFLLDIRKSSAKVTSEINGTQKKVDSILSQLERRIPSFAKPGQNSRKRR